MSFFKRYNFKRILIAVFWCLLGVSLIVLLGAAVRKKEGSQCKRIEISIRGAFNNVFIDEKDVLKIIENLQMGKLEGKSIKQFELLRIEKALQQSEWIKKAEVFLDNNQVLWVNVTEREPIARIFTNTGASFYIDTALTRIPLSDKFSARIPVFTGFSSDLSNADSLMLKDIKNISSLIIEDSFWMAQIDQVNILKDRTYELIPKVGNHVIEFGNADNYKDKFNNLMVFYKNVLPKVGLNKYSQINAKYQGQIIAIKRGMEDIKLDSIRTSLIMQMIQANIQRQVDDSTAVQLTQKDENIQQVVPIIINELPDDSLKRSGISTDSVNKKKGIKQGGLDKSQKPKSTLPNKH
jgi:cell division protein FtsQ